MTAGRRLAEFSVASEPGNERLALTRVADVLAGSGLAADRFERLKTAVAEATMNAIEHGNRGRAELPVEIEVDQAGPDIIVTITDLGGHQQPAGQPEEPDLDRKLAGEQSPRGWGLFLIRHMVDDMNVTTQGERHVVRLVVRAAADRDAGRSQP